MVFSETCVSVLLAPFDRWELFFPPFVCLCLVVMMVLCLFKFLLLTCGPCLSSSFIFVCIGFPPCICSTPSSAARASILFCASKALFWVFFIPCLFPAVTASLSSDCAQCSALPLLHILTVRYVFTCEHY